MEIHCAQCGDGVPESMGSVKAGDFDEHCRGTRAASDVRVLCGKCATFYAFLGEKWRWLVRFAWVRHPVSLRRVHYFIHRFTGFSFVFRGFDLRQ